MAEPKVSSRSLHKASHRLHWLLLIVHPGVRCSPDGCAAGHPREVKQNVIHQTGLPSSIASWSSSDAHVLIVRTFGSGW